MTIDISRAMVARLAELTPDEQRAWLKKCGAANVLILDANFEAWHNDGQKPPRTEGWRIWLMMAGRGYGKTRAGAEWIHRLAMQPGKRIALVGATIDEARAVMVEGVSGLIAVAGHYGVKLKWEPSRGVLRWPSGSEAQLYSGENPDGLRGPEHHFAWCAGPDRPAGRGDDRGPSIGSAGKPGREQFLPDRAGGDR